MLSSFEGTLELLEQGQLYTHSSATSVWTHRWCALSNGVMRVYTDRTAAIAQPEACLRSIPLETFSHLRTVGPSSEGAWELVLSSAAGASAATLGKRPQRMLPRSATSASLSQAFERSSPSDLRFAVDASDDAASRFSWGRNQNKRSATLSSSQQQVISEAIDAPAEEKSRGGSSLTLNKLSLRSKRLYRLLSGNGNSSSSLSELACTQQSRSRPSSRAGSVRSPLAATFAEASAEEVVYFCVRSATAMAQWSDAISACHAAILSSAHDASSHSLPRSSSSHMRPAIPSFESASASQHMPTSQSTSRIMRGAADLQSHFRRRREDHTRNAPSAASAMIHASLANDERRHVSADYSPRNSVNVERVYTIERPQTSGAASLRSSLSMRRPSTSTGTTSRPSTSSGRQMSDTTTASSPPSSFSAMRLNRARSERRSANSSPRLSKASLSDDTAAAASRPTSADTLIPGLLDVRVDTVSRGSSIDALRPPSNASSDGRESRFSMLRKASASSMSQPEFNGACLGLGLDLGKDSSRDAAAATATANRLRNASLAKREYPPPARSNEFKHQHRKQNSVSASDFYGTTRVAVAASASAEFLAAAPAPRAMSRSPSLFNLSAKLVSATTETVRNVTRGSSGSSNDGAMSKSAKNKSPLNVTSILPATTGDSSFGSDSAYEFVPGSSEGHASIPVISLDGCEVLSRTVSPSMSVTSRDRNSRPGYMNAARLTLGARRLTSPLSSPQPALEATSSSHSEASSGSPVTPISPLWPAADAGATDALSLKSSNSSGATISAVDHGVATTVVRPASRGGFTTVTMQRILPPTELIATLDRMRATEEASPTEHVAPSEHSQQDATSRPRSASAGGLSSLAALPPAKARRNEGRSADEPITRDAARRTRPPSSSTQQQRSSYEHSLPAPPRTVKRASPSPSAITRSRVLEPVQTRTTCEVNVGEAKQSSSNADFKVRLRRPTTPEYGSRLRGNSISTLGRSRPSPANSPSASPRRALL